MSGFFNIVLPCDPTSRPPLYEATPGVHRGRRRGSILRHIVEDALGDQAPGVALDDMAPESRGTRKESRTAAMTRTDDDSWDITESVGATALGVAMARAAESACDCPLFTDAYAQ